MLMKKAQNNDEISSADGRTSCMSVHRGPSFHHPSTELRSLSPVKIEIKILIDYDIGDTLGFGAH